MTQPYQILLIIVDLGFHYQHGLIILIDKFQGSELQINTKFILKDYFKEQIVQYHHGMTNQYRGSQQC